MGEQRKPYTLKDADEKAQWGLLKSVFDELGEAAVERERDATEILPRRNSATADLSQSQGDTALIWELGQAMWDDGTSHLPTEWVTETCPKLLNLRTVPRLNVYKALIRQIQGGVISSVPNVEFDVADFMQSQTLDEKWRDATQEAHFMAQLDLAVQWNGSFGLTFFCIGKGGRVELTHPELVLYDPQDNWQDVNWVCKFFLEKKGNEAGSMPLYDKLKWPESLIKAKDAQKYEIRAEIWVKRGGKIGDMTFEQAGMRFIIRSDNQVIEEEEWPFDFLPLYPIALSPRGKIRGASLAAECWYDQIRIDMTLAKKLSVLNQVGADKWIDHMGASANPALGDERIAVGRASIVDQLKSPGQEVIVTTDEIEKLAATGTLEELNNELMSARADLEYIMGISQAYQGIKPTNADSGKAIATLAQESSKRVARMALFLSESIRGFAEVWGRWTIYQESGEIVDKLKCKVTVVPQEEITRGRQMQTVTQIIEIAEKSTVPGAGEYLADLAPGLSQDNREKLKEILRAKEMQNEQDFQNAVTPAPGMGEEAMPETELPPEMADVGAFPSEAAVPSGSGAAPNIYQ
jgi:hypothetical protein